MLMSLQHELLLYITFSAFYQFLKYLLPPTGKTNMSDTGQLLPDNTHLGSGGIKRKLTESASG